MTSRPPTHPLTLLRPAKLLVGLILAAAANAPAQTCTTQARLAPDVRTALSEAAFNLATAVKANDAAKLQAVAIPEITSSFASTGFLVRSTAERIAADTLTVTQLYQLDASTRKPGDTTDAEFSCALQNTTAETDFTIGALPPGIYAFAMVEATGPQPWLLSFLLRQDAGSWKLAGFQAHARTAAQRDGLAYWKLAREHAAAKETWLAWTLFGEADQLLRPATFVTSTNLDKLRSEQRTAQPPELGDNLGPDAPFVLKTADGKEFRFTSINAEASDDARRLNLMLHFRADPLSDPAAARARNTAAAHALLTAHKDLRREFAGVLVFADSPGAAPFATEQPIAEIP